MERLTIKAENGKVGFEVESVGDVVRRLALIEDILGDDYDLGRLRELVNADRDGRCVVLPCKEGAILQRGGREYKADHWNVVLTAFADDENTQTGKRLELFSAEDAALEMLKGER